MAEVVKAADALAAILGQAVVAMVDSNPFTETEIEIAQTALLNWQKVKIAAS